MGFALPLLSGSCHDRYMATNVQVAKRVPLYLYRNDGKNNSFTILSLSFAFQIYLDKNK